MAVSTYLEIFFNVSGLKAPIKMHRVAEGIYAAYYSLISDVKTDTGWKWRDGKDMLCR